MPLEEMGSNGKKYMNIFDNLLYMLPEAIDGDCKNRIIGKKEKRFNLKPLNIFTERKSHNHDSATQFLFGVSHALSLSVMQNVCERKLVTNIFKRTSKTQGYF